MKMMNKPGTWTVGLLAIVAATGQAAAQSAFLYTEPDPRAAGGMEGRVAQPNRPIQHVLATPRSRPEHVYAGEITGPNRQSFRFTGLPMDRYDLVVIYADRFFEGLRLTRGDDTLTPADREEIKEIISRSEPFFSVKLIHRLEGQTGRGGEARAVCTFGRERLRRTYKLAIMRQVGPGWQVKRTREWLPVNISEGGDIHTEHRFSADLSGIRVTDQVRDLGELHL